MLKKLTTTLCLALSASTLSAQQLRPASSDKIYHEMSQLKHLVNVLYVAAHPDDENTRLLAWLVNQKNIRTGYLSLTRGDGGQNIIGSEQGEALGLIRTHELIEARKIDGAEQFFARAIDFGFSKTYTETFNHWDKNTLVGDAVWVIRNFKPDIIICRFPPNKDAGHGQHAASAIVAEEAFRAAADYKQYPEQLKYVGVWAPKSILWNTYKFGDRNTTSDDQFKMPVGDYLPTMGMGSGELAGISRSIHRSQGAGTPSVPGIQTEYFKYVGGDTINSKLFEHINTTWGRVGRPEIGDKIKQMLAAFDFKHPDASLPELISIRKMIATVSDAYWREQKLKEIDQIILDCSGIMAEFYGKTPHAVAGSSMPATLKVIGRSSYTDTKLIGINWGDGTDTICTVNLTGDSLVSLDHNTKISPDAALTEPYWLSSAPTSPGLFSIPGYDVLGKPETPPSLNITLKLSINKQVFSVQVPYSYKKLDPLKGDVVEQLRIVPKGSIAFVSGILIPNEQGNIPVSIKIHTYAPINNATLYVKERINNVMSLPNITLAANTDTLIQLVIPAAKWNATKSISEKYLYTVLESDNAVVNKNLHLIQYSHIPALQYFTDAYAKVIPRNWKYKAKNIGYIVGAGDVVPEILRQVGLNVDVLKEADLSDIISLKKYDAILVGIRAINVEKRMSAWMPLLLKYAESGGTLVMQYNTTQDMATTKMGPYPFSLASDKRVTEEQATVTVLDSNSKLLNQPNKITSDDFLGWVQERGLYFPVKVDDKYKTLLSMHDEGEEPLNTAVLYTPYGKGHYIYTSLSFFRQLPAGNTGAIRLLLNMLSVGK